LVPSVAQASTKQVGVKDFAFDPKTVTVGVGNSVHWSREAGSTASHSVTANNGFWDSGAPTSGPIDVTVTFSAGSFRYYCKVHGAPNGAGLYGMNGFVKVPVTLTGGPSGPRFRVRWATTSSDTGNAYDVQYRVGT